MENIEDAKERLLDNIKVYDDGYGDKDIHYRWLKEAIADVFTVIDELSSDDSQKASERYLKVIERQTKESLDPNSEEYDHKKKIHLRAQKIQEDINSLLAYIQSPGRSDRLSDFL